MIRRKTKKVHREGAGLIFIVLLLAPLIIKGGYTLLNNFSLSFLSFIMLVVFSFLSMFLYWLTIAQFIKKPSLLSFHSLGFALLWFALVVTFWGAFVLLFGITPTKYYPQPIDRIQSVNYFFISGVLLILGSLSLYAGKKFDKGEA